MLNGECITRRRLSTRTCAGPTKGLQSTETSPLVTHILLELHGGCGMIDTLRDAAHLLDVRIRACLRTQPGDALEWLQAKVIKL